MKNIKNILSILILLSFSFYVGCKKKDPTPQPDALTEQLAALMNGGTSWVASNVTKEGYDVTSQYTGFTLTIGEFTYTTTNSLASAWATSGTWQFNNGSPDIILRDDGTLISVVLANSELILSFSVSGLSTGGRVEGVDGDYVFTLVSQ